MSKKFYEARVLPNLAPELKRYDMAYSIAKPVYIWAYSEAQARFILEHKYPGHEIVELGETVYQRRGG